MNSKSYRDQYIGQKRISIRILIILVCGVNVSFPFFSNHYFYCYYRPFRYFYRHILCIRTRNFTDLPVLSMSVLPLYLYFINNNNLQDKGAPHRRRSIRIYNVHKIFLSIECLVVCIKDYNKMFVILFLLWIFSQQQQHRLRYKDEEKIISADISFDKWMKRIFFVYTHWKKLWKKRKKKVW